MSVSSKPRKTRHRPGPQSRAARLATIDGRTIAGRTIRDVSEALISHLGGDPSAAERLVIQNCAVMATRLALFQDRLLAGDPGEGDQHHCLAWMSALNRGLQLLGLERRARDIIPGGTDSLAGHWDKPPQRATG